MPDSSYGGNPCINSINLLSILYILDTFFQSNQGFDESNCLKFVGIKFTLSNSLFEGMKPISNQVFLRNSGALTLSADESFLFNVTFIKNQAFKAAAIFLKDVKGQRQDSYCEQVYVIYIKKKICCFS